MLSGLHQHCFACSQDHPLGLNLRFEKTSSDSVWGEIHLGKEFQGYNGFIHGGIIATLLDSAMTHCLLAENIVGMTADLQVRYKRPLKVGQMVRVTATIIGESDRLRDLQASLKIDDVIYARGKARFAVVDWNEGEPRFVSKV